VLQLRIDDAMTPGRRHDAPDNNDDNDGRRGSGDDRGAHEHRGRARGTFSASNLPPGLELEKGRGLIHGRIRRGSAQDYAVTITFTRGGESFTQQFTWTVLAAHAAGHGHR